LLIALTLLTLLLSAVLFYGWYTRPAIATLSPEHSVRSTHPLLDVQLDHASSLTGSQVTLRVDGLDIDRVTVDNGRIRARLPLTAEGPHSVHLQTSAVGLFHRSVDRRWAFSVDTKAPALSLHNPRRSPTASAKRTLTFFISGEPNARVAIRSHRGFSAATRLDKDGFARTKVHLREGRNRVTITARDDAGNTTTRTEVVYVDSIKPVTRVLLAADRILEVRPVLMATASDERGEVKVSATIDGRPVDVRGEGPYQLKLDEDLAEGRHTIAVTATDRVGNQATDRRSMLLNSTEELGENALGRGARGQDVRDLQTALEAQSLWKHAEHPREWRGMLYGPTTGAAVRQFQMQRGIDADGVAGKQTISALTMKIVISQSSHTLTLFQVGKVVHTYPVAVGSPTYPTPTGEWEIVRMEKNPTWIPPDSDWAKKAKPIPPGPDNPLGTRFMALNAPPGTVGIHGTPNPASLGYSVSHGCIRMAIPDVEDLFERVDVGTPVTIA
jgi:lipoprotein-anchoring transpeptidase ErfK/SrfK